MVKKVKKESTVTTDQKNADVASSKEQVTVKNTSQKVSAKRIVVTAILLVLTVAIWYQVGAVLFGMSASEGFFKTISKPTYTDKTVVAEVNGEVVRLGDVKAFIADVPQLKELPLEMVYPQMLDTMINSKVLLAGATASGVENDAEVIKALKTAKEQILSQAYLKKQLESKMTLENLQALYMDEIRKVERQDEILARHILVKTKKEAEDIIVQLKAGADFAKIADEKSLDKENKGGSLGYFTKNMMVPEFGEAVFAMKKNGISGPIQTPFGWHVVLIEDRRLAALPAFEDVQDQLKQAYVERNLPLVLNEERQKAGVKVFHPVLK